MPAQIVIFNALGLLAPDIECEIRLGIEEGVAAFDRYSKVESVGIAVHPHGYVSEYTGLGGMNYGPESFAVFADGTYESLRKDTRRHAAAVAVHELHHAMRTRQFLPRRLYTSPELCAGEILIMEGLAIRCEYFLDYGPSLLVNDVNPEMVNTLIDRIAPIIAEPKADWGWIYQLHDLPARAHKAMYPMGYHIVGGYLEKRQVNPIEALNIPWQEFWKSFRQN